MELRTPFQALQEIGQDILNSPDLQLIAERILDKILSISLFDLGVVRLLDPGGKYLQTLARRGYRSAGNARHSSIDMKSHRSGVMLSRVIADKATQVVENLAEFEGLRMFKREGAQSAIAVPVLAQGQILGLLQLGSRSSRSFQRDEICLLETIGEQMGIAVQKARLLEETERRAHEIAALHAVTAAVSAALNLDETLDKALNAVLLITGMETGYIQLLTPDSSELILKVHQGISPAFAAKLRSGARPGGKTLQIIATQKPIVLENMAPGRPGKFQGEGINAAAWVPITSQEKVLGIICVATHGAQSFSADQLRLLESVGASTGVALEKARLFTEADRRRRHLEALREIGLSLTATHDPQQVLQRVAEEARQLTGALFTFVVTPDKPFYRFAAIAGDDRGYRQILKLTDDSISPYGQGPLGRAIRSRRAVICEDVLTDPLFVPWREIALERGIRSLVAVPLLVQEQPVGALLAYAPLPRAYEDETMGLLTSLAAQAATALENARLFQETKRRAQEQAVLNTIARAVSQSLEVEQLLKIALQQVVTATGREVGYVRLWNEAPATLRFVTHVGLSENFVIPYRTDRAPREKAGEVLVTGRPLVINDMQANEIRADTRAEGITAMAFIPLMSKGKALGILNLAARKQRPFDAGEIAFLSSIGEVIGVAVENARLFEEVSKKSEELESLVRINRDVAALLDREILLPRIAEEARQILKADSSAFRLVQGEYLVLSNVSHPEKLRFRPKLKLDDSLSGKIFRENRVIAIRDVLNDPTIIDEHREILRQAGYRSFLGVPLRAKDRVIGTLNLYSQEEREFRPEEIGILMPFADQAAIAVENATLYQEARRREEIQKLLKELGEDIASLDLNALCQKVTEKVREFFRVDISDIRLAGSWQPVGVSGIETERIRGSGTMRGRSRWILENRRPLVVEDIAEEISPPTESTTRDLGIRGYLAVPLFSTDGQVVGVLRALTYQPREFSQEEVDLLQQLANGTAVAMENTRLFQETEARAREQAALNEIAAATSQSLRLDELLETALDKVLTITGRDRAYIRLMDPLTGTLVLASHRGISQEYATQLLQPQNPGGKSEQVLLSKEPLVVYDPDGTVLTGKAKTGGDRSIAWIPMMARGKVTGILNVSNAQPVPFAPHEVELLQAIGNVIGVAVENARLFGETQRSLERARALREIDRAMSSTLDLEKVLDVFLEEMSLIFPYPAVMTVRLWNKERRSLEPVACRNLDPQEWREEQAEPTQGFTYHVFNNRTSLVVADLVNDPRAAEGGFCQRHGLASYMGVPLTAKGECLGVIGLYTLENRRFSDEEVDLLAAVASQAALAIHNAQLYYETKKLADHLAVANKVKDEFLSVMSHELRTPLNTLIGYTEMVRDEMLGNVNDKQQEALEKVLKHAGILLDMISRVLLTTQIDAGMVKVESEELNLREFLDRLRSTYGVPLSKKVVLQWNYPPDLPVVKIDRNRLKHVLENLITNGIKFTQQGRVEISVRHIPGSRCVEFRVADTGIGIPQQALPTIFEKFRQVDSSETRLYGGVGLGLYIAKQMTERLGGTLEVQSEVGKGSTFTVKVPCDGQ